MDAINALEFAGIKVHQFDVNNNWMNQLRYGLSSSDIGGFGNLQY